VPVLTSVDFVVVLDEGVRKRHHHQAEKGKVTYFVVQLEVIVQGTWKAVIRYDCSHGFSHVDKYDVKGQKTKTALNLAFESALTYADWDIKENWRKYRDEFLKGVSNE
jgi:hypothetical protein